jgi:protein-tyrosine-phosphatase
MERYHEERILEFVPEVKNRVFLLKEFVKMHDSIPDIGDPISQGSDFYEKTFYVIKEAVNRIVDLI